MRFHLVYVEGVFVIGRYTTARVYRFDHGRGGQTVSYAGKDQHDVERWKTGHRFD